MRRQGALGLGRWAIFWFIAIGGATFDLATKALVFAKVGAPPAPPRTIISRVLELHTSHNTGALWGFGSKIPGSSMIFAGLSVLAAVVICYYLFVLGAASSQVLTIALALIMAGALGNCYDRLAYGYVRDFVHFHVDPIGFDCAIFNFADNMLVAGAITLVIYALRPEKTPPGEHNNFEGRFGPAGARENVPPEPGSAGCEGPMTAASVESATCSQVAALAPSPQSQRAQSF
jgi:signal peptidase II